MLANTPMLNHYYYAQNYASIICQGLMPTCLVPDHMRGEELDKGIIGSSLLLTR